MVETEENIDYDQQCGYVVKTVGSIRLHMWVNSGNPHGPCACIHKGVNGKHADGCAARKDLPSRKFATGCGPIEYITETEYLNLTKPKRVV